MAERVQQDKSHSISAAEYEVGRNMAVQIDEIRVAVAARREQRAEDACSTRARFTLRLLDMTGPGAFDRLVQAVGADDVGGAGQDELLVSARPFNPPETQATGRIETHVLDSNGIIYDGGREIGYFFGREGTGEEELGGFAMVLRRQLEQRELIQRPLPSPEDF